ncbi:hypothetical protein BWI17_09585 [Betaproteobacteria bacterium GR16-43]|nr:hypothetical protein BWI17_09585 [Betaproteobacteria bacterium GR16-43]
MPVALRRSTAEDLAFVTGLERSPENVQGIGQWTDLEHLAAMQSPKREHWVIERDGVPAGYLIAFDAREDQAGIYVKRILVAEKGQGTGSEALARYLDRAFGELQARFAWLHVRGGNTRAQGVYRRLGFQRFDPDPDVARRFSEAAESTGIGAFRMLLAARDWGESKGPSLHP